MRSFVVVGILVALAACDEQHGARVIVEGPVEFDHVELFFGKGGSRVVPIPPSRVTDPAAQEQDGQRYNRVAAPADVVAANETVTRLDLLFVPGDETAEYVGIVAYQGATPVGIGEVMGLGIPDDKLVQYVVTLVPFATERAEVWGEGGGPKCLYWSRADRAPIAVVRGGDPDCDELKGQLDCSPNAYCPAGSQACGMRPTIGDGSCAFFDERNNCIVGHCVEGQGCASELCGVEAVCKSECESATTLPERLACGAEATQDHVEVLVPVAELTRSACSTTVHIPLPFPGALCREPKIEAPIGGVFPEIEVSLDAVASTATCKLIISPVISPAGPVPFDEPTHHHLALSIAANGASSGVPSLTPRWSFTVGFSPGMNSVCDGIAVVTPSPDPSGEVASCPMAP